MNKNKFLSYIILSLLVFNIIIPIPITHAVSTDNILNTLAATTIADSNSSNTGGGGIFGQLFNLIFKKILGPVFNIFDGNNTKSPTTVPPGSSNDTTLKNKIVVVDPGHGGSNPGAVANNTRESDNNLAVALKLRDKLVQAGAKVIMTRDKDRTVAPEGSSLGEELAARVTMAEDNHADIFISIHSNENPDSNVRGAMSFYPAGKSSTLASEIEKALVKETGAIDKGTSSATFHVLRNTSMPSTLVEMGFVSNQEEAAQLNSDSYRSKIAQGIFNGTAAYFKN